MWGSVAGAARLTTASLSLLKVIRTTGFMKGLYTDAEMKSDNVKVGFREVPPLASISEVSFINCVSCCAAVIC